MRLASWRTWPWALFLLALPFREGSGTPEGLLVAHLAFLLAVACSAGAIARCDRRLAGAAAAFLAAAALAGALGGYRFGSLLAVTDLAVVLGTLVVGEAVARTWPDAMPVWIGAIVVAGLLQAVPVFASLLNGFSARSPGTLLNPDHAAAYLLLAFWAAAAGLVPAAGVRRTSRTIVFGAAMALLLVASIVQASRGALLALLVGGVVYLCFRWRSMSPLAQTLSGAAALVVLSFGTSLIAWRFATSHDPYRWDRFRLWSVALRVARDHPWIGVGPGVFSYVTAPFDLARADWPVRFAKHVEATHSDYLRVLSETGLLGAAACLLLLALVAARAVAAARRGGAAQAALAAALTGLLCQACVENLSARPAVSYTGALMAGLLLAGARARGTNAAAEDASQAVGTIRTRVARGTVVYGALAWAAIALVVAPYLGYRAFRLFREGGPATGARYASAVYWSPRHPDYRAALAEAVLGARAPAPADLAAGFGAVEDARVLKPVDPRYLLIHARLARAALGSGSGSSDWIRIADEDYLRAAALDPFRPQARLERGWMHETLGDPATALSEADAALVSEPNSYEARRLRVVALVGLGQIDEARAEAAEGRRRHAETAGIVPSNAYEAQILHWDLEAWSALYVHLNQR